MQVQNDENDYAKDHVELQIHMKICDKRRKHERWTHWVREDQDQEQFLSKHLLLLCDL